MKEVLISQAQKNSEFTAVPLGQTFTLDGPAKILGISLWECDYVGNNVVVNLYDGIEKNTLLATKTVNVYHHQDSWLEWIFAIPIELEAGTYYFEIPTSGIKMGYYNGDVYDGGGLYYNGNLQSRDMTFQILYDSPVEAFYEVTSHNSSWGFNGYQWLYQSFNSGTVNNFLGIDWYNIYSTSGSYDFTLELRRYLDDELIASKFFNGINRQTTGWVPFFFDDPVAIEYNTDYYIKITFSEYWQVRFRTDNVYADGAMGTSKTQAGDKDAQLRMWTDTGIWMPKTHEQILEGNINSDLEILQAKTFYRSIEIVLLGVKNLTICGFNQVTFSVSTSIRAMLSGMDKIYSSVTKRYYTLKQKVRKFIIRLKS